MREKVNDSLHAKGIETEWAPEVFRTGGKKASMEQKRSHRQATQKMVFPGKSREVWRAAKKKRHLSMVGELAE